MRDPNVYNFRRALPRMSWDPRNLFNLWRRSVGPLAREAQWKDSSLTVFQQRWIAKRLVRGYHGDFVNEKIFKRWYLPTTLPDVRQHRGRAGAQKSVMLGKWAKKDAMVDLVTKKQEEEDGRGLAPVGSLMFTELERRIDIVIFRACLAHSHTDANVRLAPGDMVTVDPKAIRFLQEQALPEEETEETSNDAETSAEGSSSSQPKPTPRRPARKSNSGLTPFNPPPYSAPFMFVPAYLEVSFPACSAIYLRHPTARPGYSEIPTPFDADGEVEQKSDGKDAYE
ncbi:mitochondrial 37S ribosomal protein nam9 [Steccherinum ochraceum]|uniref:Mitochondrial 37S ribosomal protein nam9 n=1 Tax=Steccherinum ochraceum TaxID=92696 RepID=A0A4R0R6J8_9APHY|nr:mitochondrial 37S ribosomal protein nam9 [Steccherinum ochraceum]